MKKKSLRLFALSLLMLAVNTMFAQGTWEKLEVPTSVFLKSVCFTDSLYGWAAGDAGTIIHTQDGGDTWELQDAGTNNEVFEIFFIDRNIGWAATYQFANLPYGTDLLKTTNGGEDWMVYPFGEDNIFITSIFYFDSLTGWMGGRPHALVKTTDGGFTWTHAQVDTSIFAFFPVLNVTFLNENIGYACGGIIDIAGVIWYTYNGGANWSAIDPVWAPADEVHNIHIIDSLNVIGAGGDPDFGYGVATMRTYDGAQSWTYTEHGVAGNAFDIEFRTATEAWCPLGVQSKFVYSLDAGDTWAAMETPEMVTIFDIDFPDSLHGFAVGQEGAVLRYTPPLSTGLYQPAMAGQNQFVSISPNPVKSHAVIQYVVPGNSGEGPFHVALQVFNSSGVPVESVMNLQYSGNHTLPLPEVHNYAPGIYYAVLRRVHSGNQNEVIGITKFVMLP